MLESLFNRLETLYSGIKDMARSNTDVQSKLDLMGTAYLSGDDDALNKAASEARDMMFTRDFYVEMMSIQKASCDLSVEEFTDVHLRIGTHNNEINNLMNSELEVRIRAAIEATQG